MKQALCLAIFGTLSASCGAQGIGRLAQVAVIDCDTGATLPSHFYRGEYWVAGLPGARYAIEIRNRTGERVLAVTSVDGVNVLSGATAAWDQSGYVFGPREGYQISGWRKSDAEVAAFTFTESSHSYAERTGRPANVGVIGVALFRERAPQQTDTPAVSNYTPPAEAMRESRAKLNADAPKLGTGHGAREYSYVSHTDFERLQSQPNEVVRIHYDSLDNLFAMGIVSRPRPASSSANPFPASPESGYVADPAG
jgi:hypothetical protein